MSNSLDFISDLFKGLDNAGNQVWGAFDRGVGIKEDQPTDEQLDRGPGEVIPLPATFDSDGRPPTIAT